MVAHSLSKREVGFDSPSRSKKGNKMIVMIKERGDVREKLSILRISDDLKEVEVIKHPAFEEGDKHHISMLQHLITSVRKD